MKKKSINNYKSNFNKKIIPPNQGLIDLFLNNKNNSLIQNNNNNIENKTNNLLNSNEKDNNKNLNEKNINKTNIEKELKNKRIINELNIINKGLYLKELSVQNNISINNEEQDDKKISFPIIFQANLGYYEKLLLINVQDLLKEEINTYSKVNFISNKEILNIQYNNIIIGYITKSISDNLYFLCKNKIFNIKCYIHKDSLKIFFIISLNYIEYNINIKFLDDFYYILSYNNSKIIEKDSNKSLKYLYKLKNENNTNFLNDFINFIKTNKNDESLNENNENIKYQDYLILNMDKILDLSINTYNKLFNEEEKIFSLNYKKLNKNEKEILIKFLKRTSKYINIKKLNLKIDENNIKILNDLIDKNFLSKFINFENYNSLFEFLYYLTVDELKEISNKLYKLTKINNINKNNDKNIVNEIFINNSFFDLNNFIINNEEINKLIINISQKITLFNFNENQIKKNINTFQLENKFEKHFNLQIKNKNYNNIYINNFLNYSNYRKVHLLNNLTNFLKSKGKFFYINLIIYQINNYYNDKRSDFLNNFLKNNNFTLENKKMKIIKIFEDYINNYYCLNLKFAKNIDKLTRLYFFYTEYKDLNSISKEFYGIDKFENFKISDEKIFNNKESFELYDSFYQIKNAYQIISLYNNNENLNTNFIYNNIIKIMINFLLKHTNLNLYNEIKKFFNINNNDSEMEKININLIDKLEQKYYCEKIIDNNFIFRYKIEYITSNILYYFCDICEKEKKYLIANFIYLFLLNNFDNKFIFKKRGHLFYRLILNYNHHLKNKKLSIKLLNLCITYDINKFNVIKSGYLIKIQNYYNKFNNEKLNKKNKGKNKVLNTLINYNFIIKILNENNNRNFNLNSFIKTIESDSFYDNIIGRRVYANEIDESQINCVENYALSYYYKHYKYIGIHGENSIIPSLFNIFLWNYIYYDKISYVFQSPYQMFPLDFFDKEFYLNRKELIDNWFDKLENYDEKNLIDYINDIYDNKKNIKTIYIDWNYSLLNKDIIIKITLGFTIKKLIKIFKIILNGSIKYFQRGMPDLFMWKEEKNKIIPGSIKLSEVKSTKDKLSEFQIFWIKLFFECEIDIEVLHIL